MKLTRTVNMVFQLAAIIVQFGNQATGLTPEKYKSTVAVIIGFAQLIVAYKAHGVNPDGTPATTPYREPL